MASNDANGGVQRRATAGTHDPDHDQDHDLERGSLQQTQTLTTNTSPNYSPNEHRHRFDHPVVQRVVDRLRGKGIQVPSTAVSLKNVATHSILNILFIFVPLSWIAHFLGEHEHEKALEDPKAKSPNHWGAPVQFALAFLAIIPLEQTFDWLGEEMSVYLGTELGDLLEITLNNAVEAALAIFLLTKGRLRLLQTTVIGVIILHLLLIPGTAFVTGGARIWEQQMHAHNTELNHSLLTLGVMTLVLPAAFFAALDRGSLSDLTRFVAAINETDETLGEFDPRERLPLLSDDRRGEFLKFSRACALILLGVYVCSRIFLHNPPGDNNALSMETTMPNAAGKKEMHEEETKPPKVSLPVACATLLVTVALMAVTAEWLVDSIELLLEGGGPLEEWFGLILLPLLSFAADGLLAVIFFAKKIVYRRIPPPEAFTRGLAIDLSIQFMLFWLPFFILLAWWIDKPLSLLFDFFEVACVVAACFLVNYVTADAKTNWVEGVVMIAFYLMIAITAWFYPGQLEVRDFVGNTSVGGAAVNGPPSE